MVWPMHLTLFVVSVTPPLKTKVTSQHRDVTFSELFVVCYWCHSMLTSQCIVNGDVMQ